jgi:outer membrane receptor protein involved in Fe transport
VDQGGPADASVADSGTNVQKTVTLEEVVVTAQKREERLIDVPQSVSVLSAADIARTGATQFRDFANTIPGLSFTTLGPGSTTIALRGVTTGSNPGATVGIYVDEVPYGTSSNFALATDFSLDVGLFDLDRVEVLRGPQGTLYGASTMGGLLKYVTRQPDASRFGASVQTGLSQTEHGGLNYNLAASVNGPVVEDKFAIRASGFESRDGGYIDNVTRGDKDVNNSDIYGGRLDLLFAPTEALSIRVNGFLQNISRDGQALADYTFADTPVSGSLNQRRVLPETFDQRFRLASGTISYTLDQATLTSISSYQEAHGTSLNDRTASFLPAFNAAFGPLSAVAVAVAGDTDKFTQEVRLASNRKGGPFEWVLGGFYTHEKSLNDGRIVGYDLSGQPIPNFIFRTVTPSRYEERAAFGDVTWWITTKFDVTGGLRYARNEQSFQQNGSGIAASGPLARATDSVFTYLADARYHFTERATGYLRYATGYRPGGPNFIVRDPTTGQLIGSPTFNPDELRSYEAGFKSETQDRRFAVDVAAYYIDWSDIQITVSRGGLGAIDNAAGGASVRGGELALTVRPGAGFTASGAFAYTDATMSRGDPSLFAAKGERLPNVPRFTAALNADYSLPFGGWRPTIGAVLRYIGDRTATFNASPASRPQYRLPDYTTLDLHSDLTIGAVTAQLYVHNLFDERGELSAANFRNPAGVSILQPRTVGISAAISF